MKRTPYERLAACITMTGDCWLWTGRLTRVTVRPVKKVTTHAGRRYFGMAMPKPQPLIQLDGKRVSPVRWLYEKLIGPCHGPLQPDRRICPTPLCVNPWHRKKPTLAYEPPEPTPYVPDDVEDLLDILRNVHKRFGPLDELREHIGPEFDVEHYEQAFERDPLLKEDLIRAR